MIFDFTFALAAAVAITGVIWLLEVGFFRAKRLELASVGGTPHVPPIEPVTV